MANLQKFVDQAGVSTLWSKIMEEVSAVDAKAIKNASDIEAQGTRIKSAEDRIKILEDNPYDDTSVKSLISANTTAINLLNDSAEVVGSVANTATQIAATKVAEIVADADVNFDTLKEIADWILNDTTGAADMANDIKALQDQMVGVDTTVVSEISNAIDAALKIEGVEKYALATELSALADRVKAIEDAYQNADQVNAAIDVKITELNLANTYDAKGAAAQALVDAKAYTDEEINTKIVALSAEEIDEAIAAVMPV